ncbi:hypothetical protein K488DRAFT_83017 [Vararia minispora EC-137]|uniref:Uncharacterized protein n=1 Tax=Vararia minispora EC-137 TaxID=1314806 RepID=A0ACB8QUJ4_9AGAM|nr:hypothetical protein K488DRAFT_83017 [Vararia minispora EC-137]
MSTAVEVCRLKAPSAPSWEFMTRNDAAIQDALAEDMLNAAFDYGEVWVAGRGSTVEGAAIWFAPGREYNLFWRDTFERIIPSETKDWIKRHALTKYDELYSAAYSTGKTVRVNSWQLAIISIQPASRRRGLGLALVEAKAAQVSEPLTTDVDTTSALLFFEKLRFIHKGVKNFSSGDYYPSSPQLPPNMQPGHSSSFGQPPMIVPSQMPRSQSQPQNTAAHMLRHGYLSVTFGDYSERAFWAFLKCNLTQLPIMFSLPGCTGAYTVAQSVLPHLPPGWRAADGTYVVLLDCVVDQTRGPVIPQEVWMPNSPRVYEQHVVRAVLRPPTFFVHTDGSVGLPLPQILSGNFAVSMANTPIDVGRSSIHLHIKVSTVIHPLWEVKITRDLHV